MYTALLFTERECSLVEFDRHTTELDIVSTSLDPEQSVAIRVDAGRTAPAEPPAIADGTDAGIDVVVLVRGTEHHSVGVLCSICCPGQPVPAVSAEPGHRQPILVGRITDGERRVVRRETSVSAVELHESTVSVRHNVIPVRRCRTKNKKIIYHTFIVRI